MAERKVVIHPSLNRPALLFGADRVALLLAVLMCSSLAYRMMMARMILLGLAISLPLWTLCLIGLQKMAKYDPMLWPVIWRNRVYHSHYSARSYINSKPVVVGSRWKR